MRKRVFRGLAALFAMLFVLVAMLLSLANTYEGTVNYVTGERGSAIETIQTSNGQ